MPPKAPAKGKALSKAELLELLCSTLDKLKIKAEETLERAKEERSLLLMTEAEGNLDKAMDALASHGKIAPKIKKKKILPLTDAITAVRQQISDARKAEQDLLRQERYEEWLHREDDCMSEEREALRPIAKKRMQQREAELRTWAAQEEWVRWVQCSHLPDARSEVDLNDYLTDWEKDNTDLNLEKSVKESGASIGVILQCQQLINSHLLRLDKVKRAQVTLCQGYLSSEIERINPRIIISCAVG